MAALAPVQRAPMSLSSVHDECFIKDPNTMRSLGVNMQMQQFKFPRQSLTSVHSQNTPQLQPTSFMTWTDISIEQLAQTYLYWQPQDRAASMLPRISGRAGSSAAPDVSACSVTHSLSGVHAPSEAQYTLIMCGIMQRTFWPVVQITTHYMCSHTYPKKGNAGDKTQPEKATL